MNKLTPPPRNQGDALEIELHEMARADELGFPRVPPPPPPLDAEAAARARAQTRPLGSSDEPPVDVIRAIVPFAILIGLAIPFLSAWYIWAH